MLHKTYKSERGLIHYWIKYNSDPNAKTIVFTHGLTNDRTVFEKQTEYFGKAYNIVTWDLPEHGLSVPYSDFSFKHCAEELKSILDVEGLKRVILVGHSMGGYVSQEFAYNYPEYVEAFISIDSSPYGKKYYTRTDMWYLDRTIPMSQGFPEEMQKRIMTKAVTKTKYAYDSMMAMLEHSSLPQIYRQMELSNKSFLEENKDVNFNFPVLLIVGEYDNHSKIMSTNKKWAKDKGYPLVFINDADHLSLLDNPKQVNSVISDFLRREVNFMDVGVELV